jgi:hypothetical protein
MIVSGGLLGRSISRWSVVALRLLGRIVLRFAGGLVGLPDWSVGRGILGLGG